MTTAKNAFDAAAGDVSVDERIVGRWAAMTANMVAASAWAREGWEPRDSYACDHLIPDPSRPGAPCIVVPLGLFGSTEEAIAAVEAADWERPADPVGAFNADFRGPEIS
jgi:hypothetical protein